MQQVKPPLSIDLPRARPAGGAFVRTSAAGVDAAVNTDEVGGADCIVRVQRAFLDTLWLPSRKVLEDCRDRDLWGVLKPLEVHIRSVVIDGHFAPMRAMISEEESRRRCLLEELEEEKRQMIVELERHLRVVSLPTFRKLTEGAREAEALRAEVREMCRLK